MPYRNRPVSYTHLDVYKRQITKFVEGKNFINRPMLEKQKTEGTVRKLVGFEMVDRGIPRCV